MLMLHGGAGPGSLTGLGRALSSSHRVITPTHPGWDGSPRPPWFTGIGRLSEMYLQLLDTLELSDVLVLGSSLGGWIALELTLRNRERRVGR